MHLNRRKIILLTFFLICMQAVAYLQSYVIRNVNIIPMTKEMVLKDQSIFIENGKIRQIGDNDKVKTPANTINIDGTGKYLIPGLFDMHAHFFYEQGNNVNTCEAELKMMLANGVTNARILCGDPAYLEAKQMVKLHKWAGPELLVASPQFVGNYPWPGKVFAAICKTPQEAEAAVRKFKKEGYDEIKITFMVNADVYDAIISTAKEVGIKVTGHVGPLVKLPKALAAKQQIEHMDEFIEMLLPDTSYNHGMSVSDMGVWRKASWATVDYLEEQRIPMLVKMVKDAGIYVTPTNYFFFSSFGKEVSEEEIRRRPDFQYIPSFIKKENWEIREHYWTNAPSEERRKKYVYLRSRITQELWKAGVKLMTGSDSPEWFIVTGFAVHGELETFVQTGLTPYAALETATVNPATYLGMINRKGTIEKGKEADLVLLDKNPLEDIANARLISGVFAGNKWYDRQKLDQLLKEAGILAN